MDTIKVIGFVRKFVGSEAEFKSELNSVGTVMIVRGKVNTVRATSKGYNKIVTDLENLSPKTREKLSTVDIDRWGSAIAVIIKAPGKTPLFIDTQGYDYPRYKGYVITE